MDSKSGFVTIDGGEATASVAYRTSEVIAIYPITPSSGMAEFADAWAAQSKPNLWGDVPVIQEMQSEGGAAGAAHGALQAGALTTTFTASQGLLLMIPNLYKIAGELTSAVFHVAARALATQGLSIFGDHSDVMAIRQTGWGILFSNSVQETTDFAAIATAATLASRVPFIHTFDGFRTSHEVAKIQPLTDNDLRALIDDDLVRAHRGRGLDPDRPVIRGTAMNPDVFFQARESGNALYAAVADHVQSAMDAFTVITGRHYRLFDYVGHPEADRVVIVMGSGAETVEAVVNAEVARGERVGVLKVRLFRPFAADRLIAALPASVRHIAVLDRTKEPGSAGEPLYQDVLTALVEGHRTDVTVLGGRYGLGSKEFTPAMALAVLANLTADAPKNHFTVGIMDDVGFSSIPVDATYRLSAVGETQAVFWGLGADGTVGANKNTIKIIGEETPLNAQGYFVYDSKKSGSVTISHLRFGPNPIHAPYLVQDADFVAVHQFGLLFRYPVLALAKPGATFLLNSPYPADQVWHELPTEVQKQILTKGLKVYVIDGYAAAKEIGLGNRINTIMQSAFFALSGVVPREEALPAMKDAIRKTYGRRGEAIVTKNEQAVDIAVERLVELTPPGIVNGLPMRAAVPLDAPAFVRNVTASMIRGDGDELPVSALPIDGTYPSATAQYEKRGISEETPLWESDLCIECGKCVLVCPHAVIRAKVIDDATLTSAPIGFTTIEAKWRGAEGSKFTIQISHEDCTGCGLCVEACPAKDKSNTSRKALNMHNTLDQREALAPHWEFFSQLPDAPMLPEPIPYNSIKNIQLLRPLFEFSGACSGCGETPYLKLISQLFGDHSLIANATGCSSIYGGNLPTTPWATNGDGRGPAWANSLFEDNAEFGLGMRLALDLRRHRAQQLLASLATELDSELVEGLMQHAGHEEHGRLIDKQRARVARLKGLLESISLPSARRLLELADALVEKSVWIVGGDGWAYDIGYGGLDHVLASGQNVNVIVLDTEVYSNTGGQASKSTPRAAVAKFASGGQLRPKKDLGRMAIGYGNIYVGQIAMGASDTQTVKTLLEAHAYDGPSLIIAYSHCIAHGIDMRQGMNHQKMAVESGHWPLYRFDPTRRARGENPFQLDSRPPTIPLRDYMYSEARYRMLAQSRPDEAARLLELAQQDVNQRQAAYQAMAEGAQG